MQYDILSVRSSRTTYRISSPRDLYSALQRYANAKTERFLCVTLDGSHAIERIHIVTIGLVNRTVVHPREVFRTCLEDNAVACVVAHNHPSGRLDPSPEDLEITTRLHEAGNIIGIALLDHLVISRDGYFSFVEHSLLEPLSPD